MTDILSVHAAFDGALLAELPRTTSDEAEACLSRAFALYEDRSLWLSKEVRLNILDRLGSLVSEQAEEIARLAAQEGGKPLLDSRVEISRAQTGIRVSASTLRELAGREVPMDIDAGSRGRMATTYFEPRGVVLSVSAFNHPFNLLIHQVVTAVAAGCPVLVKPASTTPLCAKRLIELLSEAGLPPGFAQMILTENAVTERLVADRRVAFLSFVGSAKVGFRLRSLQAPGGACVLEHGGVAPVIVDETADVESAIPLLTKGGFYHAGQVCVSVQRVFAHESVALALSEGLALAASQLIVGDPLDDGTEVGPLITKEDVTRVDEWVKEAVQGGAKLLCGGKPLGPTTYAPTVLTDAPASCRLMNDEVFGPVVCVSSYADINAAIERANLSDQYFQASLFTTRLDRALDVGRRLHGMAVMVNDHTAFRVDWMPFGGHRTSGQGASGISQSIRDFSIERMLVFRSP